MRHRSEIGGDHFTFFDATSSSLAELIALASRAGLDPARAIEIVASTPTASPAAKGAATSMVAKTFAPLFPIELVEKNFVYALQVAGSAEGAPVIAATRKVFSRAIREGFGARNLTLLRSFICKRNSGRHLIVTSPFWNPPPRPSVGTQARACPA